MRNDTEFIIKAIHTLNHHFEKSIQKKVEQTGVTVPQLRVMKEVVKQQGISIKQLARNLNMTQSTVSGIVDRLISKGYLTKKTNAGDKRFAEIWYTPDVAKFLEKDSSEFVHEAVEDVFRQLQPDDMKVITVGMQLLLEAIEKMGGATERYEEDHT